VYAHACPQIGFPASVLNLFGGILYWKREAEKALESSGMVYTIVRPGEQHVSVPVVVAQH
jgi:hypothetical protein